MQLWKTNKSMCSQYIILRRLSEIKKTTRFASKESYLIKQKSSPNKYNSMRLFSKSLIIVSLSLNTNQRLKKLSFLISDANYCNRLFMD